MQTLAIIAFGAVDLVVFSVVLIALLWAAVKDGQKQDAVQQGALTASPVEPARPATEKTYYKLAVAH